MVDLPVEKNLISLLVTHQLSIVVPRRTKKTMLRHCRIILLMAIFLGPTMGTRCFQCRSRGPLGDCRDPFYLTGNSTTLEHKSHGVKTASCSSGWCSKLLEDVDKAFRLDESYGGATQRECLTRPPTDNNERCAFVKLNHKEVYMCFCKGDLCNSADYVTLGKVLLVVPLLLTLFCLQ